MKAKHQRLVLAIIALIAVIGAGLLATTALKDEADYFRTPAEVANAAVAPGQSFRLGGMVEAGSVQRQPDGVSLRFVATDGKGRVPVQYRGIVPDLFKEGSGMVADGRLDATGTFVADRILAKHDERYMPPQMDGKIAPGAGAKPAGPAAAPTAVPNTLIES